LAHGAGLGLRQLQDGRLDLPLDVRDALGRGGLVSRGDRLGLRLVVRVEHAPAVAVRLVVAATTGAEARLEQAHEAQGEEGQMTELRTETVGDRGQVHFAPLLDGLGLLT